jgi:hypothetical protein
MHDTQLPLSKVLILLHIRIIRIGPMPESIHKTTLINCLVLQYLKSLPLLDIVLEKSTIQSQVRIVVYAFTVSLVVDHFALVYCTVLEYYNAVASALVLLHFSYVDFVLADSRNLHSVQVLFQVVYEFLVEWFVELGEELLDFELG